MDKPKTSQPQNPSPIPGKIRDGNTLLVSYRYNFNSSSSSNKDANLASDLI
ncbi:MAG: hypothetical protein ABSB22_00060 [Thermodesulfobacteriota bacterium]